MRTRIVSFLLILSVVVTGISTAALAAPNTVRINVSSNGTQADGGSTFSAVSQNGRYVAFDSGATTLIGLDTNGTSDIFVRDRKTGKTRRVSVRSNGTQSNGPSSNPDISGSGRFVAFLSSASNLVPGDTNGVADIFVRDRKKDKTTLVSTRSNGGQTNGASSFPEISSDGRFVSFESSANNLVSGDSNGLIDIFVKDRKTGKTRRVSVRSNGAQANATSSFADISPNGRYVTFTSSANNLVAGDTNTVGDVFLHDRNNKKTKRVSIGAAGEGNGASLLSSVSNKGQVAFASLATNLVGGDTNAVLDVFVRNTPANNTRRVSISTAGVQGNGGSPTTWSPHISASGRYVVFESAATNLVANDTNTDGDVFIRDRTQNRTRRVSVRFDGSQANGPSFIANVTNDGKFVTFLSEATNLIGGDTNGLSDIFLRSTS